MLHLPTLTLLYNEDLHLS